MLYRVKILNPVFGVPIRFSLKYNTAQFELIGTSDRGGDGYIDHLYMEHEIRDSPVLDGEKLYKRLFIRSRFNS